MTTIDLAHQQPRTYKAMYALAASAESEARSAGIEDRLIELIRIRASQMNGCAYCLRLHTRDALAGGESADRIAVLAAWWESQYFTSAEQAALALTEQVTDVTGTAPRHAVVVEPREVLDDAQYAAVSWLAIVINAYNRIAVTGHLPVGEA